MTSSVSTSPITRGCSCIANSLPLLNVTALTCSFPSRLGFTSELLGKEPGAPLNFSTTLLDCSIGWPGVAYSPLSHS